MNEYDTNRIYDTVKNIGYLKTNDHLDADCYLLNTCHIRDKSKEKVYDEIGRVRKNYKNKKKPILIIAGCVAQAESNEMIKREPYIDIVIGPQSYHQLNKTLLNIEKEKSSVKQNFTNFEVIEKFDSLNLIKNSDSNVSSFLTIQEGCDKFCKFCVVPYTRGAEFSRSMDELIKESIGLVNNGAREITLLGQNVNAYNFKGNKLSNLIFEISKIENVKRIRYTTSHPIDFSEDLIQAHSKIDKLMPIIHLPIQSGSNRILKKMNRKHNVEDYLDIIKKLKNLNPLVKFSSDFIIGYPGETEEDFNATIKLMKEVKYINSFSFIFSPRLGTPAAELNKIDDSIAKKRLLRFQKFAEEIKIEYRNSLVNKISLVLFENKGKNKSEYFGRDEYLNSVIVKSDENLRGKIRKVRIMSGNQNTLFGELYLEENKGFAA